MLAGALAGAFLTFLGIALAVALPAAAGKQHDEALRAIFPLAEWLRPTDDITELVSLFIQFPLYGAAIGFGVSQGWRWAFGSFAVVALFHLTAFGLAGTR